MSLIIYILAVIVGLILNWMYEKTPKPTIQPMDPRRRKRKSERFKLSSVYAVLGLPYDDSEEIDSFRAFGVMALRFFHIDFLCILDNKNQKYIGFKQEHFHSLDEVATACKKAGLGKANLIIGVDFTASNEWQGRKTFNQQNLHKIVGNKVYNPYQKVIYILGETLKPFIDCDSIPSYGFGDVSTTDESVFPLKENHCKNFEDILERYNTTTRKVTLGGPTSFAPIINKAIEIVKVNVSYHILVIIADGQVNEESPTIEAIVEASKHPLR